MKDKKVIQIKDSKPFASLPKFTEVQNDSVAAQYPKFSLKAVLLATLLVSVFLGMYRYALRVPSFVDQVSQQLGLNPQDIVERIDGIDHVTFGNRVSAQWFVVKEGKYWSLHVATHAGQIDDAQSRCKWEVYWKDGPSLMDPLPADFEWGYPYLFENRPSSEQVQEYVRRFRITER